MHLKDDAIKVKIPGGFDTIDDLIQAIANGSVLNEAAKYDKKYKEFFYTGEEIYPILKDVRGKIVLLARKKWYYKTKIEKNEVISKLIVQLVDIPDMGSCTIYPVKDQSYLKKCYPHVSDGARALVQDNYNLGQGKWRLVEEFLNHEIPIVYQNTEYSPYSSLTNSFYEPTNTTVFTIDLMNIQGAANLQGINC